MIKTICNDHDFLKNLNAKSATFFLGASVTKTCEIEGITQAGISGLIHLTPTLDAEFVDSGRIFSLKEIAKTPKGVPTPAIITRAVRELCGFDFEVLDLGLKVEPEVEKMHKFDISSSESIDKGAGIDANEIILKGQNFAKSYFNKNDLLILAESVPSGTTTAKAVAKILGYETQGYFSSSFANVPSSLKDQIIDKALLNAKAKELYQALGCVSDNMLLFYAGFVSVYSQKEKVVLAGGTQMAAVLLLMQTLGLEYNSKNIALFTTKWIYEDKNSDIKGLLSFLKNRVDGYYGDFDFKDSDIPILKLYDSGEAKEGVGAGGALCLASYFGFNKEQITSKIKEVLFA